jgi:hypothetical protein
LLGSQIEKKRQEMYSLLDQGADPAEILKVSQELDTLLVKHLKIMLKQKGAELVGKKGQQTPGIIQQG